MDEVRGRYDPRAATIRFEGGGEESVEQEGPHRLRVGGLLHRRILDDGTVTDYPRTLRARFRNGDTDAVDLREDGTLVHERGTVSEAGRYDLYRGFAELVGWGVPRTIVLTDAGDLLLAGVRYGRAD